jgi:hypothetical protein
MGKSLEKTPISTQVKAPLCLNKCPRGWVIEFLEI